MLRREVMKLGGLFGLGTGTPSRFPYPDRPQSGPGLGAGQGQNVRARFIIIFGSTGGLFVYNGNPAFGNLITTITATSGTDPYGNAYIGGDTTYVNLGGSGYAAMQYAADGLRRYTAPAGAGGPYGLDSSILLDATGAHVNAAATVGTLTSIGGTAARPSVVTTDTWHVVGSGGGEPAFQSGWANAGGGLASLQFSLLPENAVQVIGMLNPAGLTGALVFTIPAGYRPAIGQDFGLGFHTAAGAGAGIFGRLTPAGAFSIQNAGVGSGVICVNVVIPLAPTA